VDQAAAEAAPGRQMKVFARWRRGAQESRDPRGQALVEFGLVLPLLMVLLLGVADFGRIFSAGIAEEAAVRDAAEAGAEQYLLYLQCGSGNPDPTCGGLPLATQYDSLHSHALEVACREAQRMPGRLVDGSGNCTMPVIAVCIHDTSGGDGTRCGQGAPAPGGPCSKMDAPWSPARLSPTVAADPYGGRPYVEVRMCYRFDPLFSFALGGWGTIWLQKENEFVVTNY
jgi:hypothetical protein